ncbi:serine/threonine-protein kinase, partial [bacterium]|nr:serine/threonine-protein kinase [bacterium]
MEDAANPEKQIFLNAVELPPNKRDDYIQQACQDNSDLANRVKRLIAAISDQEEGEAPADQATHEASRNWENYKLEESIGEGGFGIVYRATQHHPVRRLVAIKVLNAGMDTKQVLARFEAERQALALMNHPGIAKVLDAGTTPAGLPFFVMELIEGVPVLRHCDSRKMPLQSRLGLFLKICSAVQHAHQKGIIHRDIKPSNILIAAAEEEPAGVPKVIDFGIAKAMEQPLTDHTWVTHPQQLIGTPGYMSPEQVIDQGSSIDTRSDVYSLGVLFYELMVGVPPFVPEQLKSSGIEGLLHWARDAPLPSPSQRFETLDRQTAEEIAAQRSTDSASLVAATRGELDWIVTKALEREPIRRYQTVNALSRDIERFLKQEPIEAAAPTRTYVWGKFIKRNKKAFAVATAFITLILASLVVSGWLAVRNRKQADRLAQQVYASDMRIADTALTEYHNSLAADLLERHRNNPIRGFEWDYLASTLNANRTASILSNINTVYRDVIAAPQGRFIAYASQTETQVLNAAPPYQSIGDPIPIEAWDIAFNPAGTALIVPSSSGTVYFDIETSKVIKRIPGPRLFPVEFSPDGQWLAMSKQFDVPQLELRRGPNLALQHTFDSKFQSTMWYMSRNSVRFTPDGRHFVYPGLEDKFVFWDLAQSELNQELTGVFPVARDLCFHPTRPLLALTREEGEITIEIWNTEQRQLQERLRTSQRIFINDLCFSPSGETLIASGGDRTVAVWDTKDFQRIGQYSTGSKSVFGMDVTADGKGILTAGNDGTIRLQAISEIRSHDISVRQKNLSVIGFLPDSHRMCLMIRHPSWGEFELGHFGLALHDPITGTTDVIREPDAEPRFAGPAREDFQLGCVSRHFAALARRDGLIELWDLEKRSKAKELSICEGAPIDLIAMPQANPSWLSIATHEGMIKVVNPFANEIDVQTYVSTGTEQSSQRPTLLQFSADGNWLTWARDSGPTDALLWICDVEQRNARIFAQGNAAFNCADFSPDGHLLAAGNGNSEVSIFEFST